MWWTSSKRVDAIFTIDLQNGRFIDARMSEILRYASVSWGNQHIAAQRPWFEQAGAIGAPLFL